MLMWIGFNVERKEKWGCEVINVHAIKSRLSCTRRGIRLNINIITLKDLYPDGSLLRDEDGSHTHTTTNTHASNKHLSTCLLGDIHTSCNLTSTS